jgi:hypothetical protein
MGLKDFGSVRNKGLAGVIQGLLTIVAQSLRRFGRAAGSSVGGQLERAKPAIGVAVAQQRSMAGI